MGARDLLHACCKDDTLPCGCGLAPEVAERLHLALGQLVAAVGALEGLRREHVRVAALVHVAQQLRGHLRCQRLPLCCQAAQLAHQAVAACARHTSYSW